MTFTRADLVITLLAGLGVGSLYPLGWGDGRGETAHILAPGQPERVIDLGHEHRYVIAGPIGDNVLEVRDGKIRFVESPCSGKQCIHSGWLSEAGDFAACLPNRVSLVVAGKEQRYDTINF